MFPVSNQLGKSIHLRRGRGERPSGPGSSGQGEGREQQKQYSLFHFDDDDNKRTDGYSFLGSLSMPAMPVCLGVRVGFPSLGISYDNSTVMKVFYV